MIVPELKLTSKKINDSFAQLFFEITVPELLQKKATCV